MLLLGVAGVVWWVSLGRSVPIEPTAASAPAPVPGDAATEATPPGTASPMEGATAKPEAEREVPPPDPNSPLHTDIPGCTCHSKDPKIVEEHASYRMNQCFGCHEGPITGQ